MSKVVSKLDRFGWSYRWKAGRIARRRSLNKHAIAWNEYTSFGLLSGLLGGLAWTFSVGLVFVSVLAWHDRPFEYLEYIAVGVIWVLISSLIVGTLIGWRMAAKLTKNALIRADRQGGRTVVKGCFCYTFVGLLFPGWFIAGSIIGNDNIFLVILAACIFAALSAGIVAVLVLAGVRMLCRCACSGSKSAWRPWLLVLAFGAGSASFLLGGLLSLIVPLRLSENPVRLGFYPLWYVVCFLIVIVFILLARIPESVADDIGLSPPASGSVAYKVGAMIVIALVPVTYHLTFNLRDSIPFWPPKYAVNYTDENRCDGVVELRSELNHIWRLSDVDYGGITNLNTERLQILTIYAPDKQRGFYFSVKDAGLNFSPYSTEIDNSEVIVSPSSPVIYAFKSYPRGNKSIHKLKVTSRCVERDISVGKISSDGIFVDVIFQKEGYDWQAKVPVSPSTQEVRISGPLIFGSPDLKERAPGVKKLYSGEMPHARERIIMHVGGCSTENDVVDAAFVNAPLSRNTASRRLSDHSCSLTMANRTLLKLSISAKESTLAEKFHALVLVTAQN